MCRIARTTALLACLFVLPGTAGCQPQEAVRETASSTADAEDGPALNPDPQHIVRIRGRAPEHFTVYLNAAYGVDGDPVFSGQQTDPACRQKASLGLFSGVPAVHREQLEVRRNGEQFEAMLVVDKYLPGNCGWSYGSSNIGIERTDAPEESYGTMVLDGSRYRIDDSVPRCHPRNVSPKPNVGCKEDRYWRLSNHDERLPVMLRCRAWQYTHPQTGAQVQDLTCQDLVNDSYKKDHLIIPHTRTVEIEVYDLDVEADPAPLPASTRPSINGVK